MEQEDADEGVIEGFVEEDDGEMEAVPYSEEAAYSGEGAADYLAENGDALEAELADYDDPNTEYVYQGQEGEDDGEYATYEHHDQEEEVAPAEEEEEEEESTSSGSYDLLHKHPPDIFAEYRERLEEEIRINQMERDITLDNKWYDIFNRPNELTIKREAQESKDMYTRETYFAAIIRHGQVNDLVEEHNKPKKIPSDPDEYDPPLTALGIKQAQQTGQFLQEYFKNHNFRFHKVIIECSPFLRCMMTAGHIASAFNIGEVEINYRAADCLHDMYGDNPIPHLRHVSHVDK